MLRLKGLFSDKNIWVASCLLFIAGILLPMFTFKKFFIFNDRFSLLGGIIYLFEEKEFFLFFVIFLFSIAGPIYKLYLIGILIRDRETDKIIKMKIIKRLAIVGKWSMADVFVVAVIVSTVKLGIIGGVTVHIGIVFFGLAVLLSMLLVQRQMADYEFRPKDADRLKGG